MGVLIGKWSRGIPNSTKATSQSKRTSRLRALVWNEARVWSVLIQGYESNDSWKCVCVCGVQSEGELDVFYLGCVWDVVYLGHRVSLGPWGGNFFIQEIRLWRVRCLSIGLRYIALASRR